MASKETIDLRDKSYIEELRHKSISVSQQIVLKHSPHQLWPSISNTDMVNFKIGLDTTNNTFTPEDFGGSQMHVESGSGLLKLVYEEFPYEWKEPYWLQVERVYSQAPMKYMRFEVLLESHPEGTLVTNWLHFVPKIPAFVLKKILNSNLKKMIRLYQQIDDNISETQYHPALGFSDRESEHRIQIEALYQRWSALMPASKIPMIIASYVFRSPERYVHRIRPFEIAALYDCDPIDTLKFFLLITKEGFFRYRWDLRCPGCKGPKEETEHLHDIVGHANCPTCAMHYRVGFDQNLEMTFCPVETIRKTRELDFCAGSPANTPHLFSQLNVWPGEEKCIELTLPNGDYIFRSLSMGNELHFSIDDERGESQISLDLNGEFTEYEELVLTSQFTLRLSNSKSYFQTLFVEDLNWSPNAVTAAIVNSLQDFKELFSHELIAADIELPVSNQVVFILALEGLQAEEFDEYLDMLLSPIQELQGVVVRSFEQVVVCIFQDTLDALDAALTISQQVNELNDMEILDSPLSVAMGLHQGPCVVLSQDGQMDYSGEAIEVAALLQQESLGGDLVISESVFEEQDFKLLLLERECKLTTFEIMVENGNTITLYRVSPSLSEVVRV